MSKIDYANAEGKFFARSTYVFSDEAGTVYDNGDPFRVRVTTSAEAFRQDTKHGHDDVDFTDIRLDLGRAWGETISYYTEDLAEFESLVSFLQVQLEEAKAVYAARDASLPDDWKP